jgi:hypothetical protein
VVQIGAKVPCLDPPTERHLGGRDQLHIHRVLDHRPHPPHAFGLDRRQALALEREGQGRDLIQEQRAPRRRLKQAGLGAFGIREGPGLEAEQLSLQQRLRDGRTIDLNEQARGTRAAVVDDPRYQPFSGAGFPLQQDGGDRGMPHGVEAGQVPDLGAQGLERWGLAHETVEGVGRG